MWDWIITALGFACAMLIALVLDPDMDDDPD